MSDEEFEEAKILYNLISKTPQAIDEDALSKIIPQLGLSTKKDDLLARLDRLMRGLPMEDEFMALAVWMERCKLIHKLDQEQSPSSSSNEYQVPDLFAVFDCDGENVPVLIDVKVTHGTFPPAAKFRLSERPYKKLRNYAELVGLPLLIAWRVSGYWTLFDIREMQKRISAYHIDWVQTMKADLMFLLLGNVLVTPKAGVNWTFIMDDLGPTGRKGPQGEEHSFRFRSMRLSDAEKRPITKMSYPQFIMWMLSGQDEKQEFGDETVEITFEVPEQQPTFPSHILLPFMLFEMRSEKKRPKNWYEVLRTEDFGPISYSQFRKAMEEGLGTFIQYVGMLVPHNHPGFIPKNGIVRNG